MVCNFTRAANLIHTTSWNSLVCTSILGLDIADKRKEIIVIVCVQVENCSNSV